MMTRKARALGMSRTVYTNASGLPDEDQLTTARDQATLGRAIQDRFPRYYGYFATPSFTYRGHAMRNHNKLLGRVEGVDGIKTGYIRASGLQPRDVGAPRQPPHRRGGARRRVRRSARRAHAQPDRADTSRARRTTARSPRSPRQRRSPPPRRRESAKQAEGRRQGRSRGRTAKAAGATVASRADRDRRRAKPEAAAVASEPGPGAQPEARFGRTDQSGQGEDHHGEGRQRADRRCWSRWFARLQTPAGRRRRHARACRAACAPRRRRRLPPACHPRRRPSPARRRLPDRAAASAPATTRIRRARGSRIRAGPGSSRSARFPRTEAKDRLREAQSLAKTMLAKADPFTERS